MLLYYWFSEINILLLIVGEYAKDKENSALSLFSSDSSVVVFATADTKKYQSLDFWCMVRTEIF
jgi:hypothetical protein